VRNPEGKRPLVSPRLKWECNIKMCLKEIRLKSAVNYLADNGIKCPVVVSVTVKFLVLIICRIS
jgi:hypothetical protein